LAQPWEKPAPSSTPFTYSTAEGKKKALPITIELENSSPIARTDPSQPFLKEKKKKRLLSFPMLQRKNIRSDPLSERVRGDIFQPRKRGVQLLVPSHPGERKEELAL